jgi:Cohesin domain
VGQKKKLLGWVLGAAAATGVWLYFDPPQPQPKAQAPERASQLEPQAGSSAFGLPSREGLSRPRSDLFGSNAPPPRAAPKPKKAAPEVAIPAAPVAPPMPYRVAGQVIHDGPPRVVLAREDRVFFVREGDMLEGGYRVESIKADGVTLVYTPLDMRQHLAAASALELPGAAPGIASALRTPEVQKAPNAPSADPLANRRARSGDGRTAQSGSDGGTAQPGGDGRPAQLRWEGPAQVQAGNEFEVALKITSDKAVRGSPMQLSYDAKALEPVAVRAGEFFADGSFTYRVNPGSIFVGAFGKGEVPDNAEFLVVTFKPIRAGSTAVSLSSLQLQGARGAVVHEPLAAFRTSISQ